MDIALSALYTLTRWGHAPAESRIWPWHHQRRVCQEDEITYVLREEHGHGIISVGNPNKMSSHTGRERDIAIAPSVVNANKMRSNTN
jgi:hypothetical protein